MIIQKPKTVFVPFEIEWMSKGVQEKKRNDLPRFLEPREIVQYLAENPLVSYRDGRRVYLEWREHSEKDLIDEYIAGVGTKRFRRH